MNTKLTFLLALLLALGLFLAGCDCGGGNSGDDDHSGADDDADDDTVSDDDAIDDDTISDDDTVSDDDTDDDTLDDDTTPDDDADDDATPFCDWGAYDPLIVAGRDALAAYDPDTAYDQFVLARNVCPDFPDAKMGLLLSDTQWYGRMIYRWYQYLINFNPAPHDDGKSIGTVIQEIIRVSLLPVNAEMYDLIHDLRTNHPDAHLYFPSLPIIKDGDHVILDMSGVWDINDVLSARAFTGLMDWFERFLLAFNWDFNYSTWALFPPPPSGATPEEIIHDYAGLVLTLLADPDYPDFLTFLPDGQQDLATSGVSLGHAGIDFNDAFQEMLLETDPQTDDVAGYVDENGNGKWDEGEPYFVPYFGPLSEELNTAFIGLLQLSLDLGTAALDEGPDDLHPNWPDWFPLSDLNFVLAFLHGLDPSAPNLAFPPIPVPVGQWFYHPLDDGLRSSVGAIANFLYDLTTPDGGAS